MKPFDLTAALAGAPVITRDGREVTQLTKFECHDIMSVAGVLDGIVNLWSTDGKSGSEKFDLFMASTKKTGWVARYSKVYVSGVYESESDALLKAPEALSYHQIEWEE
jgi:hypothetical protein